MEPNMRLLESMEAVFDSSQSRVVIAFEVLKEKEGTRYWSKATGKKARSPRVLCLTVKRSKNRGYDGTLFVCKATPTQKPYYQVRSSWEIAKIYSIEIPKSTSAVPFLVELNIEKETRNYIFHSEDQRFCFASMLLEICKLHENSRPLISGTSVETITHWWNENSTSILTRLGDFAKELLSTETSFDPEEDKEIRSNSEVFASHKDERDLNALLELFVMGPGDVQEFQTRLQDEHRALEEANVHAMLENGRAIDSIMSKLKSASHSLDDLDQNLLVFDMKLRHMKDDIAAIEARNNTLEMEARNNTKLLGILQDLLNRIEIDSESERILERSKFESERLENMIQAAGALHETLVQMDPGNGQGIPASLRRLRAVKDQKLKLETLGKGFISRANEYLISAFRQKTDQILKSSISSSSSPSRGPRLESFGSEIRPWTELHGPLLRAMYYLQKDSLASLGQIYCSTMNAIIRRRVHSFSSRLKASVKGTLGQSTHDVDIAKKTVSEARFSPLEFVVNKARESVSGSHVSVSDNSLHLSKDRESSIHESESQTQSTSAKMVTGDMELGSQLHEAFQKMLASVIPMLLDEANSAAAFLVLWEESKTEREEDPRLTEEGVTLIQNLIAGIEGEFIVLVDLTARGAHLMCLPMLATTYQWIKKISSDPISWILLDHLKSIQDRLKKTFDDFMQKQVAEIDKYDSKRSVKANGVKAFHVLPFVSNFPILVHRIESLLAEVEDDEFTLLRSSSSVAPPPASLDLPEFEEIPPSTIEDYPPNEDQKSVIEPVRKEVDLAYGRIVESMFESINSLARSDAKHGDRLRLENYSYFDTSVVPLSGYVAALDKYCKEVAPLMKEAMRKYVQQQLEYGRLWSILDFSNKIEKKLEEVNPQELAFQNGFSSQDVRSLISQTMASTDKKLSSMYGRVKKHLGDSAPKLLATVWQNVEKEVLERYKYLEKQMIECYPSIPLSPSPEELAELFKTTGPGT